MNDLLQKLQGRDCDDIIEALAFFREQVKNDFTARIVCKRVSDMCHPRAWGDRFVTGMDHADWIISLRELKTSAETALKRIELRQERG